MNKHLIKWVVPFVLGIALAACEKSEEGDETLHGVAVVYGEASQIDGMTTVLTDIVNGYSKDSEKTTLKSVSTSYPVITIEPYSDTKLYPATVTVDFGASPVNVSAENGTTVKVTGKVIFTKSAPFLLKGSEQRASFSNFTLNGFKVEGTISWTNQGRVGSNESWVFNRVASLKFTSPAGWVHEQSSDFDFDFVAGFEDIMPGNAVIEVTGTVTGESSNREIYNHVVNSKKPVVFKEGCKWAVKGEVLLTNNSGSFILDFGDGKCDNIATIRRQDGVGGVYTFTMQ